MVSGFRPLTALPSVDNMIELRELTKCYGARVAVDGLSVRVQPGVVTGFLGPNGSGKSTTMRMIVGLDAPDRGEALIGGGRYPDLNWPLKSVGALLDAGAFHPGRSARAHLAALAASAAAIMSSRSVFWCSSRALSSSGGVPPLTERRSGANAR